jgi:hypothetical protein
MENKPLLGAGSLGFGESIIMGVSGTAPAFIHLNKISVDAGALIALFFYWGWDVALNLNEETAEANHNPGRGAYWAMMILIAFYYSLTSLPSAWHHRGEWRRPKSMLFYVAWPLVSAISLISIAGYSVQTFDGITLAVGLGGIALGFIPYVIFSRRSRVRGRATAN